MSKTNQAPPPTLAGAFGRFGARVLPDWMLNNQALQNKHRGYNPRTGTTLMKSGKQGVMAELNGVLGIMEPGKPETFEKIDKDSGSGQHHARYREQVELDKFFNAELASSPVVPSKIESESDVKRVNGNGVVQTQHSSGITQQSISEINNSLGVTVRDPFASVALPITEQGYLQFNESMPKGDSGYPEGYDQLLGNGGAVEWRSDDVNNPADSPGKVVSTGNNGVLIGEDGLPVNNPFLSYEGPGGSMGALRAKEAVSGIIHAAGGDRGEVSGSKWLREGEKYVPISNENAQILMAGGDPAQQFLDNWKTKLTPPPDASVK